MNINLDEFLKEYTDIPENTKSGKIFRLVYSEKKDKITFFATFDKIVPCEDIFEFEKTLENVMKVYRGYVSVAVIRLNFSISAVVMRL